MGTLIQFRTPTEQKQKTKDRLHERFILDIEAQIRPKVKDMFNDSEADIIYKHLDNALPQVYRFLNKIKDKIIDLSADDIARRSK